MSILTKLAWSDKMFIQQRTDLGDLRPGSLLAAKID
jgi:hypothetical protein